MVIIDLQNDITKNCRDIINQVNKAVDRAVGSKMDIVYIRHNNLSAGTRTFKEGSHAPVRCCEVWEGFFLSHIGWG